MNSEVKGHIDKRTLQAQHRPILLNSVAHFSVSVHCALCVKRLCVDMV